MGKVRRLRQKYHASLVKERAEKASASGGQSTTTNYVPKVVSQIQGGAARDNMFAGLQIKFGSAETASVSKVQSDNMSVRSLGQQSQADTKMDTKRDKRKKRREELLKKIDGVRAGIVAEKDRRKREKVAVTGDLHPLLQSLPSLEELMAQAQSKEKIQALKAKKSKGMPKQKVAKKLLLSDIQMFTAVHKDPQYNRDPFAAVALALENRVLNDEY